MAVAYERDIWCDDCAELIKRQLDKDCGIEEDDIGGDDSGEYLCLSYCDDDMESDCPEHCAAGEDCVNYEVLSDGRKIGYFFRNSLTPDGIEYVRKSKGVVAKLWKEYYRSIYG